VTIVSTSNRATGYRLPWLTLTLAGLTAALFAALGPVPEALVYDRNAIDNGEWWRLLTAHWVHSDSNHLAWNLGALLVLGGVIETRSRRAIPAGLLLGSLGVDLLLWYGLPGLSHYAGLSGTLNTLLLLAIAALWQPPNRVMLITVGVVALAKIIAEMALGQALLSDTSWQSIPQAHLAGCLVGLGLAIGYRAPRSQHTPPDCARNATLPVALCNDNNAA
jgi:rhomboid family GlyGly-CTERM serine protease